LNRHEGDCEPTLPAHRLAAHNLPVDSLPGLQDASTGGFVFFFCFFLVFFLLFVCWVFFFLFGWGGGGFFGGGWGWGVCLVLGGFFVGGVGGCFWGGVWGLFFFIFFLLCVCVVCFFFVLVVFVGCGVLFGWGFFGFFDIFRGFLFFFFVFFGWADSQREVFSPEWQIEEEKNIRQRKSSIALKGSRWGKRLGLTKRAFPTLTRGDKTLSWTIGTPQDKERKKKKGRNEK